MNRLLTDGEKEDCHIIIHTAATVCGGISAVMGEGAAIGADTWFLRGTQGLMFSNLASLLNVPMTASTVFAIKEMMSGATWGVAGAQMLIAWFGLGAEIGTLGTAAAPATATARGVNSLLSIAITEKMGWGYVTRVEERRMTLPEMSKELGYYMAGKFVVQASGEMLGAINESTGEVINSETVQAAFDAIPQDSKKLIGLLYSQVHEHGIDDYGGKFMLCVLSEYQMKLIKGEKISTSEIIKSALINSAAYIAVDKSLDAPVSKEIAMKKEELKERLEKIPSVFEPFTKTMQQQLGILENPSSDFIKQFKNSNAISVVAGSAAEAIKKLNKKHYW